jgi:hypothetical protein
MKPISLVSNEPSAVVVKHLENLLAQAKAGKLRDCAYVTVSQDGVSDFHWKGERLVLIGALYQLMNQIAAHSDYVPIE